MVASTKVRPLPPGVRTRLDKMLLLLGSDNDGERAAASGMITNLLREHGLDWHDVVGSIGQPVPGSATSPKPPPTQSKSPSGGQTMTADELRQLVHVILRSPLNERARQFLAGMMDRADIYDVVYFSDKQWHWIRDLARRAGAI
jgi:hypothetical protein